MFDSALGITFNHAGILKEKGGIALSDSCGINEILNYFVSGFSFSKCGRASGTFSTALYTHFFLLIATFVSLGLLESMNKIFHCAISSDFSVKTFTSLKYLISVSK